MECQRSDAYVTELAQAVGGRHIQSLPTGTPTAVRRALTTDLPD